MGWKTDAKTNRPGQFCQKKKCFAIFRYNTHRLITIQWDRSPAIVNLFIYLFFIRVYYYTRVGNKI